MKNNREEMQRILDSAVSGFHQYALTEPFHLTDASQNLCDMLGLSKEALLSEREDFYAKRIYIEDQTKYAAFLQKLSEKEQQLAIEYRITKKDGTLCFVRDTMVSSRLPDGAVVGCSVLTDITAIKYETNNLQRLVERIPCGFMKYTCEARPRMLDINDQMLEMLRFPAVKEAEIDYLDLYKEDIYLMIPMEEHRRFSLFLNQAYTQGTPIAGELTVLRCDGTKAYLFGWVIKMVNEQGEEEFQSVCMDITDKYHIRKNRENKRYIKALSDVYDKIFEFDLVNDTICCLYGDSSPMFKWIQDIPMQTEEAIEKWIIHTVHDEDRQAVRRFFQDHSRNRSVETETKPPQIRYRALSSSGKMKSYAGIFLKIDHAISFFCCRNIAEADELNSLRNETETLKNINENMQRLISQFTEGIVAFEVVGAMVKPLYASDNICDFFGFTKEEWISLLNKGAPLDEFVSRSGSPYESYVRLLEEGEAEFTYYDLSKKSERRMKAVCSQKSADGELPRYVMLYNIDGGENAAHKQVSPLATVLIRTFGYFDVFVDGKPIAFRTQKAKELFALLVDRRGGYISSDEAIGFLWEDEPINPVTLARYRKVALRLKNILEEYGISEIVESVDGKRRLVTDKVQCDLYDYLSGKVEFSHLFKGSYLTNYTWAETTLGELVRDHFE